MDIQRPPIEKNKETIPETDKIVGNEIDYSALVNKENPINKGFIGEEQMVKVKDVEDKDTFIEKKTLESYKLLKIFLSEKNIIIGVDGGFRSIEYQREIYERIKKEYGEDYASKFVALPGTSEHHTGLAIDLALFINEKLVRDNDELMKHEDTFKEIHEHLHKYGFILRYPKDKENVTGYPHELWHIRYVGKDIATEIYEKGITLEEYQMIKTGAKNTTERIQ